jgi:hypothetical protein
MNTRLATIALAALLAGCSNIQPLVVASHQSDPRASRHSETTSDFLGAGVTVTFGEFSIDAALGRKAVNCDAFDECGSTTGGLATVRWNPKE